MKSPLCLSVLVVASFFSCCCLSAKAETFAEVAASKPPEAAATSSPEEGPVMTSSQFTIPGPLRSFLRMAGISQGIAPEEVLPLLSWNVFTRGYNRSKRSEFLILLSRYVVQARELSALAATNGMIIRASNCDDAIPFCEFSAIRPGRTVVSRAHPCRQRIPKELS